MENPKRPAALSCLHRVLLAAGVFLSALSLSGATPHAAHALTFGTYLGGSGVDSIAGIAADAAGNVYLAGWTESTNFPSLSLRPRQAGVEAFVVKLSVAQNRIIWATYLGGSMDDRAFAIAVDSAGSVRVAGFTTSPDFPNLNGSQPAPGGGARDAFLARLDPNGALIFSTYLGGSGSESAHAVALTPEGAAWVTGETDSANFPAIAAVQANRAGLTDAFVTKIGPTGVLISSTYLGGAGADRATAIAVDPNGAVYVGGGTKSSSFPVVAAAQPGRGGGEDGFVAKLNATGSAIIFSTFIGGADRETPELPEFVEDIAVLNDGSVLIAGTTCAMNFPLVQPLQHSFGGGATDAFLTRLSSAGNALLFSTYWGGASTDEGKAIAVHPDGRIYMAGTSASPDLPQIDALQSHQGAFDVFLLKLNSSLSAVHLATYFGGAGGDAAAQLAIFGGDFYVAGHTDSSGLFGQSGVGLIDGYLARFGELNYAVTVNSTVSGISFAVSGSGCSAGTYPAGSTLTWVPGAVCTVSTASLQVAGDTRFVFRNWHDGATSTSRVFTAVPGLSSLTLNFATEYKLTLQSTTGVGGSVSAAPASPDSFYPAGSVAILTAIPAPGYVFSGWSGSAAGAATPLSFTMSAPATLTANFACAYSISPSWFSVLPEGGSTVSAQINTGAGCSWMASVPAGWIHLSAAGGTGSAVVAISVDPNMESSPRVANITIASKVVALTQAARSITCDVTTSAKAISVANSGTASSVRLSVSPAGCSWTVASWAAWIQVYPLSGSGDSTIQYTVYPNFGTSVRTTSLAFNGNSVPVSQAQGIGSYNQRFAGLMYFNFFGRLASPAELALQSGVLDAGKPRGELVNSFFQTPEFNLGGRFVAGLYVGLLNRDAEFGGWLFQRNALATGIVNPTQLVSNFLSAAEYKLTYGEPEDSGFVQLLYRYVLLREASQPEIDVQLGALKSGLSRVQLSGNFLNSGEFRNGTGPRLTAAVLYSCVLLRNPSTMERDSVMAELQSGVTPRQIIDRLLASAEFVEVLK